MKKRAAHFLMKRIYDAPVPEDGLRVLVDRLWPRGLSKANAAVDLWAKDVTPSHALRQWIHSEPDGWDEFARRYALELAQQPEAVEQLRQSARTGPVTLLSAVKDLQHSHVPVLRAYLQG